MNPLPTTDEQPVPASSADRVAALAESFDCLTESDLLVLAGIKRGTAESWRKRGKGPAYIMLGNQVLYPKAALRAHLVELQTARGIDPRTLL